MVSIHTFRQAALSYPGASEVPHFEKTSFRVGKKIFATYDAARNRACVKLSDLEQDAFCIFDKSIIYPIPNKWGKQGWTFIELDRVNEATCLDALKTAYELLSAKKSPRLNK